MNGIEKIAKSLITIINKFGFDGVAISPREVILANGTRFRVEYVQLNGDGVFLSDADGGVLHPFTDLADEETAVMVYDLSIDALVS